MELYDLHNFISFSFSLSKSKSKSKKNINNIDDIIHKINRN